MGIDLPLLRIWTRHLCPDIPRSQTLQSLTRTHQYLEPCTSRTELFPQGADASPKDVSPLSCISRSTTLNHEMNVSLSFFLDVQMGSNGG